MKDQFKHMQRPSDNPPQDANAYGATPPSSERRGLLSGWSSQDNSIPQRDSTPPARAAPDTSPWDHPASSVERGQPQPYYSTYARAGPTSPPQPPKGGKRGRKKRGLPNWARITLSVLMILCSVGLVAFGGLYWYYQTNYADALNAITGNKVTPRPNANGTAGATNQAAGQKILSGKRINILLLGSDNDGKKGNDVTPLAQTNMIVSIDPQTKDISMFSIPRDMVVTNPQTFERLKLDEVFSNGSTGRDKAERVRNAAALSMETIEYNYGIHIDDYAWVGLDGFVKVIDTAGGVDVDVLHPMVDDNYPDDVNNPNGKNTDFKRLYIPAGPQHLNGVEALEYVRTRHSDLIGDFGRTVRQQQVLSALKSRLATPEMIGKAPELLKDLVGSLYTGLGQDEIVEIGNFARTVDLNKVKRVTVGPPDYAYAGKDPADAHIYPTCAAIKQAIADTFKITPKCLDEAYIPVGSTAPPQGGMVAVTSSPASGSQAVAWLGLAALMNAGRNSADPVSATHSLLDLMFMVVFESFEAGQV